MNSMNNYVISLKPIIFVLIHGLFDQSAGDNNVSKLKPIILKYFPNAVIDEDSADYGWMGAFRASWFYWATDIIPRISKALKITEQKKVVIAHSNGANFCMKALSKISNPEITCFFLSPALNARYKFKEEFKSCNVLYSRTDSVVLLAKLVLFSRMGAMGRYGPLTKDKRVFKADLRDHGIKDHSDYFKPDNHEAAFKPIRDKIEQELFFEGQK